MNAVPDPCPTSLIPKTHQTDATPQWYVYLMRCADNSLYTGVTTDPERRVREHNGELKGKGASTLGHEDL